MHLNGTNCYSMMLMTGCGSLSSINYYTNNYSKNITLSSGIYITHVLKPVLSNDLYLKGSAQKMCQ